MLHTNTAWLLALLLTCAACVEHNEGECDPTRNSECLCLLGDPPTQVCTDPNEPGCDCFVPPPTADTPCVLAGRPQGCELDTRPTPPPATTGSPTSWRYVMIEDLGHVRPEHQHPGLDLTRLVLETHDGRQLFATNAYEEDGTPANDTYQAALGDRLGTCVPPNGFVSLNRRKVIFDFYDMSQQPPAPVSIHRGDKLVINDLYCEETSEPRETFAISVSASLDEPFSRISDTGKPRAFTF